MTMIEAQDAQRRLDELVARVEAGERFTITRDGRPVADLVPHPAGPRPRLGAYAVVVDDGRILLVRQGHAGAWSLPGGGVHAGEPPTSAVLRELREETGLDGEVGRVLAVHDNVYDPGDGIERHGVRLLYAVTSSGAPAVPTGDEVTEIAWWPLDELPPAARPWVGVAAEAVRRL